MILHCMKKSIWLERSEQEFWGQEDLDKFGYLHCSTVDYFWRVAPNFKNTQEDMVLICLDESRLTSEVCYEDGSNGMGRLYPHIYGLVNQDAIVSVLPYLRDRDGTWIKNPELAEYENR